MMKKYSDILYSSFWNSLVDNIKSDDYMDHHEGLRVANIDFNKALLCKHTEHIIFACLLLLIKYAYTMECDYGKFTLGYTMKDSKGKGKGILSFILGHAIVFRENGSDVPLYAIYNQLNKMINAKKEEYEKFDLFRIFIRIYITERKACTTLFLSYDEIGLKIWESISSQGKVFVKPKEARTIRFRNRSYHKNYVTSLNPTKSQRSPFIVADIETVIINNVHVPYALGLLVVNPCDNLLSIQSSIETYFSEDHIVVMDSFKERSIKILSQFIDRLAYFVKENPSIRTVYFHNFSRFDGIILLKHLVIHDSEYRIKPIMRNNRVYEIAVYLGKKFLFCIRDSLLILPNSLYTLAKNMCPELGTKGEIAHEEINQSNLLSQKAELLEYMKQDILLLGGVMLKAQDIYWTSYKIDILSKLTMSSLSLAIFRTNYLDPAKWHIHIPNRNEDSFFRRGYYGGHSDVYIPFGENLHYYDVNSLYPFIMKSFPMPLGKPVWHSHLQDQDLDNLFGFIEAYVECPSTISRPFLPYLCSRTNILLFPTGKFSGVYYSEELKYARQIGYKIIPISGYLFEQKNSSPFVDFVTDIFQNRQEAKREGNDAMSYVYKILMNSLYGRFGINPKSTITEIGDQKRYNHILKKSEFISGDILKENCYVIHYYSNTDEVSDLEWNPPKISAVQLSAAVTACSRIHMYPYISREDCYYTDTDSVVLGSPLPDDVISSTELGKFKKEYLAVKGIFLAPKSYFMMTDKGNIIKHKGPAKESVNEDWFVEQYADLERMQQITVKSNFRIDWNRLDIKKMEMLVNRGIKIDTKRDPIYDNKKWVNTKPKHVDDLDGIDIDILKYEIKKKDEIIMKQGREIDSLNEQMIKMMSELKSIENVEDEVGKSKSAPHDEQDKQKDEIKKKKRKNKPG